MLSRLAESLYWIGRYVERADDTARIIESYVHRMAETPPDEHRLVIAHLFTVLGVEHLPESPPSVENALAVLAYDAANPSAIAGALRGAFENARRSRDTISSEMWVAINATRLRLPAIQSTSMGLGPSTYLQYVRERAALVLGLADSTMSRDDAWRFLMLGRSVERMDMTARLLRSQATGSGSDLGWMAFLRASGAMEAYMRSAQGLSEVSGIAAFLLLDRFFPRSVLFMVHEADHWLRELQATSPHGSAADPIRQQLVEASTVLEFLQPEEVLPRLLELLDLIENTCISVNDQITARFFNRVLAVSWMTEGGL
jgi:uncharacterized alpha-E superfamily protein